MFTLLRLPAVHTMKINKISRFTVLFRIDKSSPGVSRIGVANPSGMIVHTQKVMPILSSMLVLIGFSWPCVSGSTSGLWYLWDVPSVDTSTLGQKTLYELASLKYCYNTFFTKTCLEQHFRSIEEKQIPEPDDHLYVHDARITGEEPVQCDQWDLDVVFLELWVDLRQSRCDETAENQLVGLVQVQNQYY